MKKILFTLLILFALPQMSFAQDDVSQSFLSEGKTWTYRYSNFFQGTNYIKTYVLGGDIIINDLKYSMICDSTTSNFEFALREENKKVYVIYPNQESELLVFDFGKDVEIHGETTIPLGTEFEIKTE